jgi:hypothetical protein
VHVEVYFQGIGDRLESAKLRDYARRAVRLEHPSLLCVVDVCVDETGRWALVLHPVCKRWLSLADTVQCVEGHNSACSIALSLSEALAYLHRVGFRGGMSFDWGEQVRAVCCQGDSWHLALVPPTPRDIEAQWKEGLCGNPWFMAPEMLLSVYSNPTPVSDSFSLGALLFELLAREPLLEATSLLEAMREVQAGQFRKLSRTGAHLPDGISDFILRALCRQPSSRPSLLEWSRVMADFGGRPLPPPPAVGDPTSQIPQRPAESRPQLTSLLKESEPLASLHIDGPAGTGGYCDVFLGALPEGHPSDLEAHIPEVTIPQELQTRARLAETRAFDPVDFSVFGPPTARAGELILIQVFLHLPEQAGEAKELAEESDVESRRLGIRTLELEIRRGVKVRVHLAFTGLDVDDPVQELTWRGRSEAVQFGVEIPTNSSPGNSIGKVSAYVGGIPIGHVKFKLRVEAADASATSLEPQVLGEGLRRYKHAFVSYASEDRTEVLKRTQMLERCGVRYFQDLLSLKPGDRWEKELYREIDRSDLFLLFWSTAARESRWVQKEVQYALDRQRQSEDDLPEIVPVMIEGPPVPEPPAYLSHLHFNDRLLYFMSG